MILETVFIDNSVYILLIFATVIMSLYAFWVTDKQNFSDIILSFISGFISFIIAMETYNGVNYVLGGTVDALTWCYQSSSVGTLFVIYGVIMFLVGIAKIYDIFLETEIL